MGSNCQKLSKCLGILKRFGDQAAVNALHNIKFSILQFNFDYCSSVWDSWSKGSGEKFQNSQNRGEQELLQGPGAWHFRIVKQALVQRRSDNAT